MYRGLSWFCAVHTGTVPQTSHDHFHQTVSNYSSTNHPNVLNDNAAAAHARSEVYTEFTYETLSLRNVTMYSFETTVRTKRQDTLPRHTAQEPSDSNRSHLVVQTTQNTARLVHVARSVHI